MDHIQKLEGREKVNPHKISDKVNEIIDVLNNNMKEENEGESE